MVSRLIDIEFVSASRYNIELLTGTDLTGSQLLPRWPLKPKYYVTSRHGQPTHEGFSKRNVASIYPTPQQTENRLGGVEKMSEGLILRAW